MTYREGVEEGDRSREGPEREQEARRPEDQGARHPSERSAEMTDQPNEIRCRGGRSAERLVREWAELHRDALMANWDRGRSGEPLAQIEPLP